MDVEKTIRNLKLRGYSVRHFATGEEAAAYLDAQIDGTTVGIGGCMTAKELGLYDRLAAHNEVFWHWIVPGQETIEKANAAAVYISSANAMTEGGEILNIDGNGNRLAGQVYGRKRLFRSAPTLKARFREHAMWRPRATRCASRRKKRPASSTANATTAAARTGSATRCSCCGRRWAA